MNLSCVAAVVDVGVGIDPGRVSCVGGVVGAVRSADLGRVGAGWGSGGGGGGWGFRRVGMDDSDTCVFVCMTFT